MHGFFCNPIRLKKDKDSDFNRSSLCQSKKIETRTSRSPDQIQSIIEAVYTAQREALQLPEDDRNIRYIEHKSEHFHVSFDKNQDFMLIEITLFAGRSLETKRKLYEMLVENLANVGIASNDISIILYEVPVEN